MAIHAMVDLETMGVASNAAITNIGIVVFDTETYEVKATHQTAVDLQSCLDAGLTVTAGTIKFWMTNKYVTQRAREHCMLGTADHGEEAGPSLHTALAKLGLFLTKNKVEKVWGNGSASDNVWLRSAYEAAKMTTPKALLFFNDMCLRTVKQVAYTKGWENNIIREGTYHDSLDDALHQIKELKSAMGVF